MKKNRVAVIGIKGYPYVYGGYETLIASLSHRLRDAGVEVTIYCHRSLFDSKPAIVNGIHLWYIPAIETNSLSQLTHSFLSTVHACFYGYDALLYVNLANAPFGFLPRLFGTRTVINVDGMEWLRPKWKGPGSIYYRLCARLVRFTFSQVITDAEEMRKTYWEDFRCNSVMIPYGAERELNSDSEILKKYNLEPNSYYLVVGRMIPDNNLDIILREFVASKSNKFLVVVGDDIFKGAYSKSIQEICAQSDHIILTGYIRDYVQLTTLYRNCLAYIHGHEYGGTNPTLVLAMQEACLILALDTRFNKEVIDNGENGVFFNKEAGSLAGLIEKAAQNEYLAGLNQLKIIGPLRVEQHYNWDHIAKRYREILIG